MDLPLNGGLTGGRPRLSNGGGGGGDSPSFQDLNPMQRGSSAASASSSASTSPRRLSGGFGAMSTRALGGGVVPSTPSRGFAGGDMNGLDTAAKSGVETIREIIEYVGALLFIQVREGLWCLYQRTRS